MKNLYKLPMGLLYLILILVTIKNLLFTHLWSLYLLLYYFLHLINLERNLHHKHKKHLQPNYNYFDITSKKTNKLSFFIFQINTYKVYLVLSPN